MTENSNSYPVLRKIVKILYFVHLVIALAGAIYIILKHPQVVSSTISFAMLVIYGFMLIWALLLGFILIVRTLSFSYASNNKKQSAWLVSLWSLSSLPSPYSDYSRLIATTASTFRKSKYSSSIWQPLLGCWSSMRFSVASAVDRNTQIFYSSKTTCSKPTRRSSGSERSSMKV